jgi:hypothetical protein
MNQRFKGALPRADQATPSNEQKHASRDEMHAFRGSFSICFNGGDPHDPQRGCNSRAPRETIHVLQGSDTAIQGRRYTRCKEGGPQGSPSTMRFGSRFNKSRFRSYVSSRPNDVSTSYTILFHVFDRPSCQKTRQTTD